MDEIKIRKIKNEMGKEKLWEHGRQEGFGALRWKT